VLALAVTVAALLAEPERAWAWLLTFLGLCALAALAEAVLLGL
jgi:hypothetical protein